ncbi:MAG: DUF839 domain-containing protein [Proteobacteria bacterium]|nr:DUF839 domain-containing protein [Burkholderiales bacterium]
MSTDVRASRRSFLKSTSSVAAAPFVGSFAGLYARQATAAPSALIASPYGPIAPVNDITTGLPLLKLPAGFTYKSYGWTGDAMTSGGATPGNHDGMAVVRTRRVGRSTEITLVRNHELGLASANIPAAGRYDTGNIVVAAGLPNGAFPVGTPNLSGTTGLNGFTGGGTTNLVFRDGNWAESFPSLGGTLGNCAGGLTPWGTWLTCEETVVNVSGFNGRKHGYVFEVRPDPAGTTGVPIVAMGRMPHEAVAVDPLNGIVYETEDNRNAAGLYRFIPTVAQGAPGTLEQGGRLQGAKVIGVTNADLIVPNVGDTYRLEWMDVVDPDADPQIRAVFPDFGPSGSAPAPGPAILSGPFAQAWDLGALRMSRGEGIWYWNRKMYIVDTGAGLQNRTSPAPRRGQGDGAVWELDLDAQTLTCIYAVPQFSSQVGNNPDNVTVSPKGGILLCEDGGNFTAGGTTFGARLMGLTLAGDAYSFAENNFTAAVSAQAAAQGKPASGDTTGREFCGACFDPTGRVLFVNLQTPGVTFAISGPWGAGPL